MSSSIIFHLLFGNRKIHNNNKDGLQIELQDVFVPV